MKNQKGFVQILLVIGIVAALAVIGFTLYSQKKNALPQGTTYNPLTMPSPYQNQYQQAGQAVAPIKNTKDLNAASASLDSADTTQIDTHLNALNSASAGF